MPITRQAKSWLAGSTLCAALAAAAPTAEAGGNLETIVHGGTAIGRVRWSDAAIPVKWRLNSDAAIDNTNNGNAATVTQSQVRSALAAGFDSWRAIGSSRIDFDYDGLTATGEIGLDGENVVTWRDPSATGGAGFLAMAAVFALTEDFVVTDLNRDLNSDGNADLDPATYPAGTFLPAGTIVDADISFNSEQYDWVVNPVGGPSIFDIQAVATHEQGHFIGLAHSTVTSPNATMYPFVVGVASAQLDQRTLTADDAASASNEYPEDSYASSFSSSFCNFEGSIVLDPSGPVGADGVSVYAIDARTLEPVVETFTVSRFSAGGEPAGSFRIQGLRPGDYVLAAQYFDGTDERTVWTNRYNLTVALSNVNNGNAVASDGVGLGFAPRPEFWNAGESTSDDRTDPTVVSLGGGDTFGGVTMVVNTAPPVSPPGATFLNLPKDGFAPVVFGSQFAFPFYGSSYTTVFVGANGYLTFGAGDTDSSETKSDFLSPEPRIAALFDALNPGTPNPVDVYRRIFPDRVEITWLGVPEATNSPSNTFRVTIFSDGEIEIEYDFCRARDAIVGISPGGASPSAHDIDFSRTPFFAGAPGAAILEQFKGPHGAPSSGFDLWGGKLRFRRRGDNGYDVTFEAPASAAAVGLSSVDPGFGPEAGGTEITVRGFGFTTSPDTTLLVGGAAASDVAVVNGTTITATTPPGTGLADVRMQNGNGADTLAGAFRYFPPPTVLSIDPSDGPQAGGTFVTISGADFTTTADTQVFVGGSPLADMRVTSGGVITGFTPPGSGAADVVVQNGNGSGTLPSGFEYVPPPSVLACDPEEGPQAGGTPVTLTGTNFSFTGDTSVRFGSRFATHVNVLSPTTVTCRTPNGTGVVDVLVTNGYGTGTLEDGFRYVPPPDVASVTPNTGPETGGTPVAIAGANFTTSGDTVVLFGSSAATSVSVVDSTRIECVTPPGTGMVSVRVTNSFGSDALDSGFKYRPAPRCTSLSPDFGSEAGGTVVTIVGGSFFADAGTVVLFGSAPATAVTVLDATRIRCTSPAGTGVVDVVIENRYGRCTMEDAFEYGLPPEIQCRYGNVNAAVGAVTPVLFLDGSIGDDTRSITLPRESRVTVDVEAPPANVSGSAAFVVYIWGSCPTEETLTSMPFRLGDMCMPTPLTPDERPQPFAIFNNFGIPRALGRATHPSVPAPSRLFVGRLKRDMFIQGLIVDDSSPRGLSVTNGIKIDVE